MYTVEYPLDPCNNGQPIYQTRQVEMLNARYGKIKTDVKATQDYKRMPNKDYWPKCEISQFKEGPYHPSDAWNMFKLLPYIRPSDSRETYLYDIIDTATGYVVARVFDAKKFVDMFVKDGFYLFEETTADIQVWRGRWVTEQKKLAVYASGIREIRTYRKYELTRT